MGFSRNFPDPGRKKLSDIFHDNADMAKALEEAKSRPGGLIPPGPVVADIVGGGPGQSKKKQSNFYRVTFEVAEGEFRGQTLDSDHYMVGGAIGISLRQLVTLGLTEKSQYDEPPPPLRCRVFVGQEESRTGSGKVFNKVDGYEVIGPVPPTEEPVAADRGPAGEKKVAEVVGELKAAEAAGKAKKGSGKAKKNAPNVGKFQEADPDE